jgi:hypothetical protein
LAPTRLLGFLRRDHPGGWRAWVEFAAGPEVAGSLAALDAGLQPHGDAFETANGAPFFEWMSAHPDRHAVFDAAMAAGARMHGLLLADAIDWSASRRVCDVGGGDGSLLRVLLGRHPHLQGVLLELPDVVARAPAHPAIEPVPGDAFRAVPPGCDTYLFVNVLHDWDDDAAVALLQCAAEAMSAAPPDGPATRVVIVDSEAHDRPRDDLAIRADVLMLALTPGGRERTAAEFATLAQRAGLRLRRTRRLLTGDAVHVLEAAGRLTSAGAVARSDRPFGRVWWSLPLPYRSRPAHDIRGAQIMKRITALLAALALALVACGDNGDPGTDPGDNGRRPTARTPTATTSPTSRTPR